MQRRNFIKTFALMVLTLPSALSAKHELLRADKRHIIKKGWMNMKQSFNYFDYDSADEMGFGILRMIDDFSIANLDGTPKHPHKNMEILSIVLEGQVFHQDSMGNSGILKAGAMQLMSAGSGLEHAETNPSRFDELKGLQIWLSPHERNTAPHYQEVYFNSAYYKDRFAPVFAPEKIEMAMHIKQNARLYRMQSTKALRHLTPKASVGNGFYIFVIEGSVDVLNQKLDTLYKRDGVGISGVLELTLHVRKKSDILLFEIPMKGDF